MIASGSTLRFRAWHRAGNFRLTDIMVFDGGWLMRDKEELETMWRDDTAPWSLVALSVMACTFSTRFWAGKRVFITDTRGLWVAGSAMPYGWGLVTGYTLPQQQTPNFDALGLETRIKHVVGDLRDADALKYALLEARPEIVFHLAAQPLVMQSYVDPVQTWSVNVQGSANLPQP